MPKAPRATDGTTKKRSRKNNLDGNGATAAVAQPSVALPEAAPEVESRSSVIALVSEPSPATTAPAAEELIRARAYELYLQRGGRGGSPEQDWLQAVQEICGQQQVA
jgi:hypothetical protein